MYENINNFAQKRLGADYRQSHCHEVTYKDRDKNCKGL
jgi:hypothetical protein